MKKIKRMLAVGLVAISLSVAIGSAVSAHSCTCGLNQHVYDKNGNCVLSCC